MKSSRRTATLAVAAITLFTVACHWIGIDFGRHWDERPNVIRQAQYSIMRGTVLPGWYYFPSVLHDLALLTAAPEIAELVLADDTPAARRKAIITLGENDFLLRLRRVTSALSALVIVWVFVAVLQWRSPLEALLAAAITAGSWELQYHGRWLTADPLVAQFGAMTLAFCLAAFARRSRAMLLVAAVAAGLACGTKYPGGALLLPLLMTAAFLPHRWKRAFEALAVFTVTFFVTTPGAIVHTDQFFAHVRYQAKVYGTGVFAVSYYVATPAEHLARIGTYFALVVFSPFLPLAIFLAVCVVVGAVVLFRADRRIASIIGLFPIAYVLYFSLQKMMVVRNLLVVIPFLAVFSAAGLAYIIGRVQSPMLRRLVSAAVAAMLLSNFLWLFMAARSIAFTDPREYVAQAAEYLEQNAHRRIAVSPDVREALRRYDGRERQAIPPASPDVELVMFYSRELSWGQHEANRWNYTERWFGPREVNFNYYPTWFGRDRIVVAPRQHLKPFRR